jgi:hypothetical protein
MDDDVGILEVEQRLHLLEICDIADLVTNPRILSPFAGQVLHGYDNFRAFLFGNKGFDIEAREPPAPSGHQNGIKLSWLLHTLAVEQGGLGKLLV